MSYSASNPTSDPAPHPQGITPEKYDRKSLHIDPSNLDRTKLTPMLSHYLEVKDQCSYNNVKIF